MLRATDQHTEGNRDGRESDEAKAPKEDEQEATKNDGRYDRDPFDIRLDGFRRQIQIFTDMPGIQCTIFGGVPISVSIPPMREAKAMGMSSREGLILALQARLTATGRKMAVVPVELMKADSTATVSISATKSLVSLVPAT